MLQHRKKNGFTLIELMISVGIVGILSAIAYPSYQSHIVQSRRADAQAQMMSIVNALERNFTQTNTYVGVDPTQWNTSYYTFSIVNGSPTTYTITATPVAGSTQVNDTCTGLSINNIGNKTPAIPGCWGI